MSIGTGTQGAEEYINNIMSKLTDTDIAPKSKADMKCAPGLKYEAGACARLAVMVAMAKAYNKSAQSSEDHIKLAPKFELLNPQKYKAYLVYEINNRVGDSCTSQKCWSTLDFIKYMESTAREEYIKYTFRPTSPQGKFEWLSTFDINDSMTQYEKKFNGFKFLGAVPMDFSELSGLNISGANYEQFAKNKITKLGVIFNLDNHDQPGSHWTAMYTDFEKGCIFYFDSFGIKPEIRVRELMREHAKYLESVGWDVDSIRADYNQVQHQKGDSECGVYSMNFLIRLARGDDFDKLCSVPISDKQINKCRSIYFDKYSHKKTV
jgi:hypothetical protein